MARLTRKTQYIFGSSAGSRSLTAFGTAKNDTPTFTSDPAQIQNNAYNYGWEAGLTPDKAPYEEDTNALFYLFTYQLAYLMQQGIPEYDPNTTYYRGSVVSSADGSATWYKSLADDNLGNPLTDTVNWQEVQLGKQGMPLFTKSIQDHILQGEDAIGWALQGTYVEGSVYQEAFQKLLNQYNAGAAANYRGIQCTLSSDGRYIAPLNQKDAIDNLFINTGVADFYIIDTSNTGFYLPKNSKFLQFTTDTSKLNQYNAPALPAPNLNIQAAVSQAGGHTHTRGTMNITGTMYPGSIATGGNNTVFDSMEGAFYFSANGVHPTGRGIGGSVNRPNTAIIYFDAARSWVGETSQNGAHTHDITISSQSSQGSLYGQSDTVQVASSLNLLYYLVGKTAV